MGRFLETSTENTLIMFPLIEGIFFGLLLSVMIGPVFFTLLQTSLEQGFYRGLFVALGATISDMMILAGCFLGYVNFSRDPITGKVIGLIGVLILLFTGLWMIKKPRKIQHSNQVRLSKKSAFKNLSKGFAINSMNPFVFVFWLGTVSFTTEKYQHNLSMIFLFIIGALLVTISTDLMKVYFSSKLKTKLNFRLVYQTSVIVGLIMIAYSIHLFYQILI